MKRGLLARLRSNGVSYIISALLFLAGIPLYQALLLAPQGYNTTLSTNGVQRFSTYLGWISTHSWQFLVYRILLLLAFALLFTLPYSLYRIIVAQELLAQEEIGEKDEEDDTEDAQDEVTQTTQEEGGEAEKEETGKSDEGVENGELVADAWRGKGLAIIAVWSGVLGLVLYLLGTLVSTLFLIIVSQNTTAATIGTTSNLSNIFTIVANTGGIGLLALATLFFGAFIARSGLRLWPGIWVAFGYMALGLTPLLIGSAVGVATAPGESQGLLGSLATLLFAIWVLWCGIMLVRLKPE